MSIKVGDDLDLQGNSLLNAAGLDAALNEGVGYSCDVSIGADVTGFGGSFDGDTLTLAAAYGSLGVETGDTLIIWDQADSGNNGLWTAVGSPDFERTDTTILSADHVGRLIVSGSDVGANDAAVLRITAANTLEYLFVTQTAVQTIIDASIDAIEIPEVPYLNVQDYGATGDGSTDDTEAFEDTIDALPASGGSIYVPPGTYIIRRPISLPDNTELFGAGSGSVIKKIAGLEMTITAGDTSSSTSITVDDATGLAVGDAIYVQSDNEVGWQASHAVVTDISGTTVTFTPGLRTGYSAAPNRRARRTFPIIQNVGANTPEGAQDAVSGLYVHDLTLDQNWTDGEDEDRGGPALLNFTVDTIHWDKVRDSIVERVQILNSCCDGYGDQAREGPGNTIQDCKIVSPMMYGVHLGTTMTGGGKVLRNTVVDAANPSRLSTGATNNVGGGLFYCANVTGTLAQGNEFRECWSGFFGGDWRDVTVAGETGDQANRIIGNDIVDQISTSTQRAIDAGWQAVVQGNTVRNWYGGGIRLYVNCRESVVVGNFVEIVGAAAGIELSAGADKTMVMGNTVTCTSTSGQSGIALSEVDDCVVQDNLIIGAYNGVGFSGCNRIFAQNRIVSQAVWGHVFSGSCSDIRINVQQTDLNPIDEGTLSNCTRYVINGVGENGENDPASAGDWYTVTNTGVSHTRRWAHHGMIVHWTSDTGATHHWSIFKKVIGNNAGVWSELT